MRYVFIQNVDKSSYYDLSTRPICRQAALVRSILVVNIMISSSQMKMQLTHT